MCFWFEDISISKPVSEADLASMAYLIYSSCRKMANVAPTKNEANRCLQRLVAEAMDGQVTNDDDGHNHRTVSSASEERV